MGTPSAWLLLDRSEGGQHVVEGSAVEEEFNILVCELLGPV